MVTGLADLLLDVTRRIDEPVDRAALERTLASALARARSASPGVDVGDEAFVRYLGERLPRGGALEDDVAAVALEDLFLACGCAHGSAAAIALVEARCLDKAKAALARLRGQDAVADDALQQMRQALFVGTERRPPRIVEYRGQSALARWIRTVAMRAAFDMLAPAKEIAVDGARLDELRLPSGGQELELIKRQYGAAFKAALAEAVGALPVQTRAELRAYYIEGRGLEEMAREQGVAASTISRRLAKARETLWTATRRTLVKELAIDDGEIDSILRLLATRLELSRSALAPPTGEDE